MISRERVGQRGLLAAIALASLVLGGCDFGLPPGPTAVVEPTASPTASPEPVRHMPGPLLTLPPTWTPTSSVTAPPTRTPPPPTATRAAIAALPPTLVSQAGQQISLRLTEAQLNAALARRFDANPLSGYAITPRVALGYEFLMLALQIFPPEGPAGAEPQLVTLRLEFHILAGTLETFPTQLVPLGNTVSTRQVKAGEALLLQALVDLVDQAVGNVPFFYHSAAIRPDGITLTLILA